MVYSTYGIPGAEALAAQNRLAVQLNYKLKREYSEMCGFLRSRISLAIVRSNCLLLCSPRDKGVCIRERPVMADREMMALLGPWRD